MAIPNFSANTNPLQQEEFFRSPVIQGINPVRRKQALDLIDTQEQQREEENELTQQRLEQNIQNSRQRLLSEQMQRGITGGLAESQQEQLKQQAGLALSEKEQKELLEKEFTRKESVQRLRQVFAQQLLGAAQKKQRQNYNQFQRSFQSFNKTTLSRMMNDQDEIQTRLQQRYELAVAKLNEGLEKAQNVSSIMSSIGSLVGAIGGGYGAVGAGAGTALGSAITKRAGRRKATREIVNPFRQGAL